MLDRLGEEVERLDSGFAAMCSAGKVSLNLELPSMRVMPLRRGARMTSFIFRSACCP